MAKTGSGSQLGTAEGALSGRALHATHAESPVLDDFWAIELLSPEGRAQVRASSLGLQPSSDFDARPILAVSLGCLRYAEDEVEQDGDAELDADAEADAEDEAEWSRRR